MAYRIVIIAILLSSMAPSLQEEAANNTDYDYEDDYYDDFEPIHDSEEEAKPAMVTAKDPKDIENINIKGRNDSEELTTEKVISNYEVTELVIDVPDVNTRRIPIVTNFTVTRPLNFAGESNGNRDNKDININDNGDEVINAIFVSDKPKVNINNQDKNLKDKKDTFDDDDDDDDENDYFSHFAPSDNFDDEFDKEFGSDEDDVDYIEFKEEPKPREKNFKDYFHNFKKGLENRFKSFNDDTHNDGFRDSFRKLVNGPHLFFRTLHNKSSALANKLHKAIARHKTHDKKDDDSYSGYGFNE